MTRAVALRPVRPEDEPLLRALFAETRPELAPLGAGMVATQYDLQQRQYAAAHPHLTADVVEVDGAFAGRLLVGEAAEAVTLVDIALLPAYQGQGAGTAVLHALLERAGDRAVQLHVVRDNPALRLYARLGFEVVDDLGLHLAMRRPAPSQPKTAS